MERAARIALVVLVAAALAAILIALASQKPDLAQGKSWQTSSTKIVRPPEQEECTGGQIKALFHTNAEEHPWFEYDMGSPVQAPHQHSVAASGESTKYFAEYKFRCLDPWLSPDLNLPILDYGCGVGSLTTLVAGRFNCMHGFDPSKTSLNHARSAVSSAGFFENSAALPNVFPGIVVMSGVLHHVARARRHDVLCTAVSKLRSEGLPVVFEHTRLNPLTRRAVGGIRSMTMQYRSGQERPADCFAQRASVT